MKPHAAWFEVACTAAALLVAMLLVMWTQSPASGCALSFEAPRPLVLSRETDREHLARDLASAERVARRYTASTPRDAQQHGRFLACEATLVRQIGTMHDIPPGQLPLSAQ